VRKMKVKCPACYAEFYVPDTATTVTCPYCGAVFTIAKDRLQLFKEGHFYFPLDKRDPFDILLRFVERQYGAPAEVRVLQTQLKRELYYIPVHFFYVYGKAKVYGRSRKFGNITLDVKELDYIGIPAVDTPEARILNGYPFPIRGKRFFEERIKSIGKYYEPTLSKDNAERIVRRIISDMLRNEARESVAHVKNIYFENLVVDYRGLIHYPLWKIVYKYKNSSYTGFIDGATGIVINAEHPLTPKGRIQQFAIALSLIAVGVLFGSFLFSLNHTLPAIVSFVTGFISGLPALTRSVSLKVRASELKELDERKKLLFDNIMNTFIRFG